MGVNSFARNGLLFSRGLQRTAQSAWLGSICSNESQLHALCLNLCNRYSHSRANPVGQHLSHSRNLASIVVQEYRNCRLSDLTISACIHVRRYSIVPDTYGVGPVSGAENDPKTKGSTPDDFRATFVHMIEPKEITKEAAAAAAGEPPGLQVKCHMPGWDTSAAKEEEAAPQKAHDEQVFEENPLKVEGTAQAQDETPWAKPKAPVEGQYGAGPSENKTSRS